MFNAVASGLTPSQPLAVVVPSGAPNTCVNQGSGSIFLIAPSALGQGLCRAGLQHAISRICRHVGLLQLLPPSGPNPSFASLVAPGQPLAVGYATQVALATVAGYPKGFGVPVPFNSVDAQLSNASSWYNALTFNLTKRFSMVSELLPAIPWSHSIDAHRPAISSRTSGQPFLQPGALQFRERPAHRWGEQCVFQLPSPSQVMFLQHLIADFHFSPIIEYSSGRPFNVITGENTRLDFSTSTGRPSVAEAPLRSFIPGVTFGPPNVCLNSDGTTFKVPS